MPNLSDLASGADGDLQVTNGQLVTVVDAAALAQRLYYRLSTFRGEWALDPEFGVDYYADVLRKNPDRALVDSDLRDAILGAPGVRSLLSLSAVHVAETRTFTVSFTVDTVLGVVSGSVSV